jgi:hypothetical protein
LLNGVDAPKRLWPPDSNIIERLMGIRIPSGQKDAVRRERSADWGEAARLGSWLANAAAAVVKPPPINTSRRFMAIQAGSTFQQIFDGICECQHCSTCALRA